MNDEYKKNPNVPALGLKSVFLGKEVVPHHYHGKSHVSPKPHVNEGLGFRSERVLTDQELEFISHFNSSEPERKHKVTSPSEKNFYLYKNFNKFIQNFYVKNEQAMQQKAIDDKIKEKYMNHPYQNETSQAKAKKLLLAKKPNSIVNGKTTNLLKSPSRTKLTGASPPHTKLTGVSPPHAKGVSPPHAKVSGNSPLRAKPSGIYPFERIPFDDGLKKLVNKRPKTGSKRPQEEQQAIGMHHPRGNSAHLKNSDRTYKSLTSKEFEILRANYANNATRK